MTTSGSPIPLTPETPTTAERRRVATIDVGTNSIRLLVAEAHADGSYRLLDDEKVVARLGRGTSRATRLEPEAMREAAEAIAHMREIAEGFEVELLHAVATCAVREAENRAEFLALVREAAGIEVEVITGEDEGRLAWISAQAAFDLRGREIAVVDVGGGSTEIVIATGGVIEQIASLSIGAVRLAEAVPAEVPAEQRLRAMRRIIREHLDAHLREPAISPREMIGTGGTFTTLAVVDRGRGAGRKDAGSSSDNIRGYALTRADVRRVLDQLAAMTPAERLAVPGLGADRSEIIVAGLAITESVMKRLGANRLVVHDRGIRDGLLISMTRQIFPDAAREEEPPDRVEAARRFARKCGYESVHVEHVTRLALTLFDRLLPLLPQAPRAEGLAPLDAAAHRELLEAAGVLHDVGYYIDYSRHHRHSYHLIVHADLPGFRHREQEMVAAIARYHRRAHPKAKHPEVAALAPADRSVLRQLAAILRIADGLDRAHAGNVRDVRVRIEEGIAWFDVVADREPKVDLWGAARKSELFRKTFGWEPSFRFAGDGEGSDRAG